MTKLVYGISILLVSAGLAVAQSTSSPQTDSKSKPGTSSQPNGQPGTTDQAQPPSSSSAPSQGATGSSSGETTVQGCIGGSGDNFTLTDQNGKTWQLQSNNNAAFKDHIGHTVSVTGTPGSDGTLKVTSASMISANCSNSPGSAPSPKPEVK